MSILVRLVPENNNPQAGQNTVTISAPAQSQLVETTVAAGQNTVVVSAPAQSQLVAITLAAGQNTVVVSAPAQTQLVAITLAAGQNTVTITAPTVPAVHLTMPQLVNTVAVSAPAVPAVHLTMPQTVNTVVVSAPAVPAVHLTMPQTVNTVVVSAPVVPAVHLTMPQLVNTVAVSAPAQSQLVEITLVAGQNTVVVSAPAQSQLVAITLAAGQNTVTVSAPAVPAVHLTMPQLVNTVVVSAPTVPAVHLTMPQLVNTVVVSAPVVPAVHLTMPQLVNTVVISAPEATLSSGSGDATLAAGQNTVVVSAPVQTQLVTVTLAAGQNTVTISAPAQSQSVVTTLTPLFVNGTIYSEDMTQSPPYLFEGIGVAANVAVAPDGFSTADKVYALLSGVPLTRYLVCEVGSGTTGLAANHPYVWSMYLKAAEFNRVQIDTYDNSGGTYLVVDVSLSGGGSIVNMTDYSEAQDPTLSIVPLAGGWYRVGIGSYYKSSDVRLECSIYLNDSYEVPATGDGVSGVYVWGMQVEPGRTPGVYQKTGEVGQSIYRVDVTAPAQSQIVEVFLAAGQQTVLVTAPAASLAAGVDTSLIATAAVIVVSAPTMTFQPTWAGLLRVRHEARIKPLDERVTVVQAMDERLGTLSQVVNTTQTMLE